MQTDFHYTPLDSLGALIKVIILCPLHLAPSPEPARYLSSLSTRQIALSSEDHVSVGLSLSFGSCTSHCRFTRMRCHSASSFL